MADPLNSRSDCGQALTEFLISLIGILIGVYLFFSTIFFIMVHFQIKFELQNSLICLTSRSQQLCSQQLRQALSWSKFGCSISQIHLTRQGRQRAAKLTLSITPYFGPSFERKYSLQTEKI